MTSPSSTSQSHASASHGGSKVRLVQELPQHYGMLNEMTPERTESEGAHRDQSVVGPSVVDTDSCSNGLTTGVGWLEGSKWPNSGKDHSYLTRGTHEHKTSVSASAFGAQSKMLYDEEYMYRDVAMIECQRGNRYLMDCHDQIWAASDLKIKGFAELREALGWQNGQGGNTALRSSSFHPQGRFYAAREDIEECSSP